MKREDVEALVLSNMEKQATPTSIEWSATIPYGQSLMGSITFHQSGEIITLDPELATFLQLDNPNSHQSKYVHSICVDEAELQKLIKQVEQEKVTKGELLLQKKRRFQVHCHGQAVSILVWRS